jgi:hypothetical protein
MGQRLGITAAGQEMVQPGIEFRPVHRQQPIELGQGGRNGRPIRILYPGMELDKGSFDFGFGHVVGLELKYLNQRVGSGLFPIHPPALGLNHLV